MLPSFCLREHRTDNGQQAPWLKRIAPWIQFHPRRKAHPSETALAASVSSCSFQWLSAFAMDGMHCVNPCSLLGAALWSSITHSASSWGWEQLPSGFSHWSLSLGAFSLVLLEQRKTKRCFCHCRHSYTLYKRFCSFKNGVSL